MHHLEIVTLEPLVTELDSTVGVHVNERANVFENELLHVLENVIFVISHHNVGLDLLEPFEYILLNNLDLEEHGEALLIIL